MTNENPVNLNKPVEEWTHNDLITWMAWEIVAGITRGEALRSVVFQFPHLVMQWKEAKGSQHK